MGRSRRQPWDRSALTARPDGTPPDRLPASGQRSLVLEQARDSLLYVPGNLQPGQPAPLVLLLHGAGGEAAGGLSLLLPLADTYRLVLAAASSRAST